MFCDRCGAAVQADQRFCGKCGKEFAAASVVGFPRPGRVASHVRLLGILWLAFSAVNAVGGIILYILANTLFVHLGDMGGPQAAAVWLRPFLSGLGVLILIKAAVGFLAGWGLLQRESWARMLTLVLAFLALFHVPFGTAVGVYTLWVLLPAESDAEYQAQARTAGAA